MTKVTKLVSHNLTILPLTHIRPIVVAIVVLTSSFACPHYRVMFSHEHSRVLRLLPQQS